MFVTTQAGRIVSAATHTLSPSSSVDIGCDGLSVRIKISGDGVIINECDNNNPAGGYKAASGEIIEFSGKACVYNSANSSAEISVIVFDII